MDSIKEYIVTKSGFRTKNASDMVPAEMIEKWFQKKPACRLDDLIGMDEVKEMIRRKLLPQPMNHAAEENQPSMLRSFLFYGPCGVGKTLLMEATAGELMDREYQILRLDVVDIHSKYAGVGEKVIQTAFQEAADKAPCIICLDGLDMFCPDDEQNHIESHMLRLCTTMIEAYDQLSLSQKPVILLAASHCPERIHKVMLSKMTMIPVPLPSEEVRKEFFRIKLRKFCLADDIDETYMAHATENDSFRDLERLTDYIQESILDEIKERFGVRDENGKISLSRSLQSVTDAVDKGKVKVTKELFDKMLLKLS